MSGFGTRNIMTDVKSNGFVFIEDRKLEHKIFNQVIRPDDLKQEHD